MGYARLTNSCLTGTPKGYESESPGGYESDGLSPKSPILFEHTTRHGVQAMIFFDPPTRWGRTRDLPLPFGAGNAAGGLLRKSQRVFVPEGFSDPGDSDGHGDICCSADGLTPVPAQWADRIRQWTHAGGRPDLVRKPKYFLNSARSLANEQPRRPLTLPRLAAS